MVKVRVACPLTSLIAPEMPVVLVKTAPAKMSHSDAIIVQPHKRICCRCITNVAVTTQSSSAHNATIQGAW